MTREEIEAYYLARGYVKNRYGKLMSPTGNTRIAINDRVLRVERKIRYDWGETEWVRLRSAYHGTLRVTEAGKLAGKWYF